MILDCHKIIDHQQVEVAVGIVVCLAKNLCSVGYIAVKESEILMFVTNGEKDISEDNGFAYLK